MAASPRHIGRAIQQLGSVQLCTTSFFPVQNPVWAARGECGKMNGMNITQQFYATMAELQSHAQRPACPIYAISKDETVGALVGSGFLLEIAGRTFLITAAHVFYLRHEYNLFLPGSGKPISFGGQAYYTGPAELVPDPDSNLTSRALSLLKSPLRHAPDARS